MTSITIKSTDSGAPILSNQAGSLLGLLDACLIVNNVFTTADDTTFTDRTTEARSEGGTAFALLPTPAAADRIYFGMPTTFPKVKFDVATAGVGGTYVWEYWNSTAWTTLTVTDGTSGFTVDGTVSWTIPGTWATTLVNSVDTVFTTTNDTSFTDRTTEARSEGGTAFTLFPTPATADRVYIGMPTTFSRAQFDLATNGIGGTYTWEYWSGAAWTALTVTDGTTGFTGDGTVTWVPPTNWATTSVNSVTKFWVRVRPTVVPTTNPTTNFIAVVGPQYWVRIRASANPSTTPTINFLTVTGWTRSHSGTNQGAFRLGTGSNGFFLRVDDSTTATTASTRVVGYETLTTLGGTLAADVATGRFPTDAQVSGGLYWNHGDSATVSRPWVIVVSEKLVHYWVNGDNSTNATGASLFSFGDIKPYKTGDLYHTLIVGATGTNISANNLISSVAAINTTNTGHYIARSHTQLGTSLLVGKHTDNTKSGTTFGNAGLFYPNPADGGLYLAPIWVHEAGAALGNVRGELPGMWVPCHDRPLANLDTFSGTGTLAGRTFIALRMYNISQVFLETSDTWTT